MKKNKLRIGIIIDTSLDLTDGVQQYVLTLGRWLMQQGHTVHFLAGQTSVDRHPDLSIYSLAKNMTVRGNKNVVSIPLFGKKSEIDQLLSEESFDVLHVQMPYHPLLAGKIINRANEKVAVFATFHIVAGSSLIAIGTKLLSFLQKKSNARIDRFMSVSSAAQSFLQTSSAIDSIIMPNVVNVSAMRKGAAMDSLRGSHATIVFLGRLVERKGASHLLEAIALLHSSKKTEGVKVHICGDGPDRQTLESFVSENDLSSIVTFHGRIAEKEKPNILASADIAIFPSTGGESFGIVLIEAMAAGAGTVLAGNNEGYATVMEGSEKQLFDPSDYQNTAEMLDYYMSNKPERERTQKWQEIRIHNFDVAVVGPRIVKQYQEVIHKKLD